jgi:hypothetical protein
MPDNNINSGELVPKYRDLSSLTELEKLEAKNLVYSDQFDQRNAAKLAVSTRLKQMKLYGKNHKVLMAEFVEDFDHLTYYQKKELEREIRTIDTPIVKQNIDLILWTLFNPHLLTMEGSMDSEVLGSAFVITLLQYIAAVSAPIALTIANFKYPAITIPAEIAGMSVVTGINKYKKKTATQRLTSTIEDALINNPIPITPKIDG